MTIQKGVRQGCILSSCLFNLYSEKVISEALELQHGITLNGEYISNVRYADDTALVAETGEQLQQMINNINDSCNKYGMSLNAKNTKVMVISKKDTWEQLAITVNNTRLEQVKQYTYLGSLITDDGRCIQEVKKRIGQAKSVFWKTRELLRGNVNINTETYRRLLKISWTRRVTNGSVKQRVNVEEDLVSVLVKWKLKCMNVCLYVGEAGLYLSSLSMDSYERGSIQMYVCE